jgi:hypothetical protein
MCPRNPGKEPKSRKSDSQGHSIFCWNLNRAPCWMRKDLELCRRAQSVWLRTSGAIEVQETIQLLASAILAVCLSDTNIMEATLHES